MRSPVAIFLIGIGTLLSCPQPSGAQWVQTGWPGGGDIRALLVSGMHLLAGTEEGEVWRLSLSEITIKK